MGNKQSKMMADLHRLLETQDFKSDEDIQTFVKTIGVQGISSSPKEVLSFKERAQDLVFEAYELSSAKAKTAITEALHLDPDCIEAYEFLGRLKVLQ